MEDTLCADMLRTLAEIASKKRHLVFFTKFWGQNYYNAMLAEFDSAYYLDAPGIMKQFLLNMFNTSDPNRIAHVVNRLPMSNTDFKQFSYLLGLVFAIMQITEEEMFDLCIEKCLHSETLVCRFALLQLTIRQAIDLYEESKMAYEQQIRAKKRESYLKYGVGPIPGQGRRREY